MDPAFRGTGTSVVGMDRPVATRRRRLPPERGVVEEAELSGEAEIVAVGPMLDECEHHVGTAPLNSTSRAPPTGFEPVPPP